VIPYRSRQTVRFGDIDQAGIVYYPRILHFCHVAMEDYFAEALDLDYSGVLGEERFGLPAVHVEIDFLRPLSYGDRIEVEVEVEELGRTSVHWRYTLYRAGDDAPLATARIVTVGVDLDRFEKRPLPPRLRSLFAASGPTQPKE